jgi:anti-anti-sigma factor
MELNIKDLPEYRRIALCGALDLYSANQFKATLSAVLASRTARDVVLDLSETEHIDSSGLALLSVVRKLTLDSGGRLALIGVKPGLIQMLDFSQLRGLFFVAENEAAALAAFQTNA